VARLGRGPLADFFFFDLFLFFYYC
jgi:hypothetical protein